MNKILYVGLVLTLCLVIFNGCNKKIEVEETNDQTPLESLIDEVPSVEEVYKDIPSELKVKVVVPSIDVIPFEVEKVVMHSYNDSVSIAYYGEDKHVKIGVWRLTDEFNKEEKEQVALKNNITGYYNDEYRTIGLQWKDPEKDSDYIYNVGMVTFKENSTYFAKNVFSKEDATKIANSMINNYVGMQDS